MLERLKEMEEPHEEREETKQDTGELQPETTGMEGQDQTETNQSQEVLG